jgi:hypothetical protein
MPYFQIDPSTNSINGEFARPQIDGPNFVELPETDPRVVIWRNPPPRVPDFVTQSQAKIQLLRSGLLDQVKAAVASDPETQLWFDTAIQWRRVDPRISTVGAALNLTSGQIDSLFIAAAAIN